jgi:hypothetical protein
LIVTIAFQQVGLDKFLPPVTVLSATLQFPCQFLYERQNLAAAEKTQASAELGLMTFEGVASLHNVRLFDPFFRGAIALFFHKNGGFIGEWFYELPLRF